MKNLKFISIMLVIFTLSLGLVGCKKDPGVIQTPDAKPDEKPVEDKVAVDFPKKDIRFIIPNAAGGGNDAAVRALIPGMKDVLGVNLIPENQPGSTGVLAAMEIINGEPDGYKLYFNSQTLLIMPNNGMPDVDVEKFQPVAQVVEDTAAVMVNAKSPYNNLDDLIKAAKDGKLKVGHTGVGSLWHLAAITFADAIDADFQYIAYTSGGTQMLTALAAGEVDLLLIGPPESKALIDAEQVKALAVGSDVRHSLLPDVPTAIETGVSYNFPVWRGVFTTAGVDEEVLQMLSDSIKTTVESEEFIKFANNNGFPIKFRGQEEFTEFFNDEKVKYKEMFSNMK